MIHDLKIWPEYFEAVRSGLKAFEIRKNDRDFHVGESIHLREYDPNTEEFTGRSVLRLITYIIEGPPYAAEGYAVMSIMDQPKTDDIIKSAAFCSGYEVGYANGCSDSKRLLMGTGIKEPVGINIIKRPYEDPVHVRAERMIRENQERNKEFRNVR